MSLAQFKQIWRIMRLRSGPQGLPYSYGLLAILLSLHLLIDIVLSAPEGIRWQSLLSAMINTLFTGGFVFVMLQWTKKSERFVQTLCALLGAEVVIGIIGVVLLLLYQIPALVLLVSVFYLLLIIWNGLIAAHIFHIALETSMLWGVALALLYLVLAYQVIMGVSRLLS